MKKPLFIFCALICSCICLCQDNDSTLQQYDFWIGDWNASWDEGNGVELLGTNSIKRILNERIIEEDFRIMKGASKGFKGQSYSVYHQGTSTWRQAWVDNQGGYFDFYGYENDGRKYFSTDTLLINGNQIMQRMAFYDIKEDSFTWDWESSNDLGATWTLQWRIFYTRKEKLSTE